MIINKCLRCKSTNVSSENKKVFLFNGDTVEMEVTRCHAEDCGTYSYRYEGRLYFKVPTNYKDQNKLASIASQMRANARKSNILK